MTNAVVMTGYGPPEVLRWAQVPLPEPGEGQIRLKVKAAGISPTDLELRAGHLKDIPLPANAVLGFEAAGTVDAAGAWRLSSGPLVGKVSHRATWLHDHGGRGMGGLVLPSPSWFRISGRVCGGGAGAGRQRLTAPWSGAVREGRGRPGHLQAAQQVAQRLGVGLECRAAVAGQGHRGSGRRPVAGLVAAQVVGASVPVSRARISPTVRSRPSGSGTGRCAWMR
jgi:Alcohol dehydrogenase GroES-like domain